jgi:hypothetical protein
MLAPNLPQPASEQGSVIEAFEQNDNSLLNQINRQVLLSGLSEKQAVFFINLEKTIKSGQSPEQIIDFVLKSVSNGDIDSSKFYKLAVYAEYCPLLESFSSITPHPSAEVCREAIGNKGHEIWKLLTECQCMNARVLHMGFVQERYPEESRGIVLSGTRSLINEIGLRHRTKEIEKPQPRKIELSRAVFKQVFSTVGGFVGKY